MTPVVPRLVLAYDRLRPEERLLAQALEARGMPFERCYAPQACIELGGANGGDAAGVVVLQRCTSQARGLALARLYEARGARVVNPASVAVVCGDKLATSAALAAAGVPTPRTGIAFEREQVLALCQSFGYPVVIKPTVGSWGRMVSRLADADAVEAVLDHKRHLGGPHHAAVYVQEHVPKPGRDIRAFVVGDRVVAAIYRSAEHWITNTARGARASACALSGDLVDRAERAAAAVGGGVLAVDMVESDRGLLVLEVNHTMEFRNSIDVTGVDIAGEIAAYLGQHLGRPPMRARRRARRGATARARVAASPHPKPQDGP